MVKLSTLLSLSLSLVLVTDGFAAKVPSDLPKLVQVKNELTTYLNSHSYLNEINSVTKPALAFLKQQVAKNEARKNPRKLAVVFDIDETLLSNTEQMIKFNFGGNQQIYSAYNQQATAALIEPTSEIFHYALDHRVAVFLITGRENELRAATLKNLHLRNLDGFKRLDMWPLHSKQTVGHFKSSKRCQIVKEGYDIVLNIGDQNSDMDFQCSGLKKVKLPNPFYYIPSSRHRKV